MEHLGLGWVLLAGTLAGTLAASSTREQDLGPIIEVAMDMAQNSFDDQYWGCRCEMEEELKIVNGTEFENDMYAKTWRRAEERWREQWGNSIQPQVLRREYAVAVLAYTSCTSLYRQLNAAVREGGRSREHYLQHFPFKTMHFLLTKALHTLRKAQGRRCYDVYRSVRGIRFTARRHQTVRFGQFASTSIKKNATKRFGQDSLFIVHTCYGVPIQNFSFYPEEEEVLIPPYEVFKVTNVMSYSSRSIIHLHSHGVCSNYNCALVNGHQLGTALHSSSLCLGPAAEG
ncbi:NAD(P)(+)--arginine ADP-ribosyltransferase 2-like [Aythya fuligula]|uniref:NAD(P)(+)--arginine ADP-ribosyltransferase n=1 Tax=Aythya fuligula TaxID=219594 RepID=A0A6J3EKI7_AYTFU|nr:NAD(P)(+)--arginine ADP-ribosyltransferase 2-like [Aythya fuligula]